MEEKKRQEILKAVALRYEAGKNRAPLVAATGRGMLAEKIVSLARENKIPVVEDRDLAKMLGALSPGEEVPQELYEAVAAIYAFIMEADRRKAKGPGGREA